MRKWHLYIIIIALFVGTYFSINKRYDKFYRVNGINNDNRAIIEANLSKEDQNYLVENQIPIKKLIKYMSISGFKIQNYQYYNLLINTNRYSNKSKLVKIGNQLKEKATKEFTSNTLDNVKNIIQFNLEDGYLNNEGFDYQYLKYYQLLRPLYDNNQYVDDLTQFLSVLHQKQYDEKRAYAFIKEAVKHYDMYSLGELLNTDAPYRLIDNPESLSVVINDKSYIGSYRPKSLVLLEKINRVEYAMYATDDTYQALIKLYEGLGDLSERLVVRMAYQDYTKYSVEESGHNEYQLGTSIVFTDLYNGYNEFENEEVSKWLENHAYEYGFILRYPKDKASSTNHKYDAHIYRYVGVKLASELHQNNQTLEEYNQKQGGGNA